MAVVLEQFIESLSKSGLMSSEETQAFLDELESKERPQSGGDLAKLLYRKGRLTRFQAEAIYHGKTKGLVLGDYVVLDQIGAGGMGQVYQARHQRMKRLVALKVLPGALTKSPDAVNRFQREVEAAAKLIHPNIVTAYDAGESAGLYFLVMECIEGHDLAAVVQQHGPLDVVRAVDYTRQAALGLAYAHDEGIVHRDIKPSNLLVDKKGVVKILDMGLARFVREAAADESTAAALTQTGQVMGTVDYMSPEQAVETKKADKPADIYSLGATLFFLLTGRPMYLGDTLVERLIAHRDQPVPSLRPARSDVSERLNETFRAMVAKKPALRQKSMEQVIEELDRCHPPKHPGTVHPPPTASRTDSAETLDMPAATQTQPERTGDYGSTATHVSSAASRPPPRRVAAPKRSKKRQSAWDDAVKQADKQYKRRHNLGWVNKLRTLLGKATGMTITIAVAAAVLVAGYYGVRHFWQGHSIRQQCETNILQAVAPMVKNEGFEPLRSLRLTNLLVGEELPENVEFEASLMGPTAAGRRPIAKMTGKFERASGRIVLKVDRFYGTDLTGVRFKGDPVP